MKKLGLGLLGLLIAGAIYYFTVGSKQITSLLQQQLNTELTQMQTQGFTVSDTTTTDNAQHFTVMLDDPKKALPYLKQKGLVMAEEDLAQLQGAKLGVDVLYEYTGVGFDLYPVSLPQSLYADADESDKKLLQQLEAMMTKKAFLVHAEVDPSGTAFTGNMKDINETLQGEGETIHFSSKGLQFKGTLDNTEIKNLDQSLDSLAIETSDELHIQLLGLQSTYASTGATAYDYTTQYSMQTLKINGGTEGSLLADGFSMQADSTVKEGLLQETLLTKTKSIKMLGGTEELGFENTALDIKINNLDVNAFEKLQNADPQNQVEMQAILQQIVSKNVQFELTNLSADTVVLENQRLNGFTMNARLDIDKSLDIASLQINPMTALESIKTNLNVSLSKALFEKLSTYPDLSLVGMFVQPEIANDTYTYRLELKNGDLLVNGKSLQ